MKSGYKEYLDQYKDLVNEPTWADGVGDAFSSAGKGSAKHPEDHQANALLSGVGGGLKGAANEQRRAQLSPMLEQAGQITARAAEIEAQTQIATQSKMQVTQLFEQTAVPIAQLSQASLAGDINASNQLAKGVYARFKQGLGDPSMGDFDHYHNGTIYYENPESGVIEGRNIIGLMYQAGINPIEIWGQDAPMIEAGLSPGAKKNYEDSEKIRQLEMQGKQADIANKYSQTNYHNAQAGKLENEMNAPRAKYDDKAQSHIRTENSDWINTLYKNHKDANKAITAQTQMRDAIQQEIKNGSWSTGSSTFAELARWANAKSGNNKTQQLLELKRQPLFKDLKNTFGARITDNDLATWMTTQVDLHTDPRLAIETLDQRIQETKYDMQEELLRREILETEFSNSEPYNSLLVDKRVQERLSQNTQEQGNSASETSNSKNKGMVIAEDPETGEQQEIPIENMEEAKNRGLIVK